ncbi:transcription termination/antitermination protein NusG [Chitinophaga flava]|uniref:Antitermination protein NusG n=1 Tax=Chitinophaga flava TaxID=2259036 RepID=A0A365XXF8_9BACT|nr:UpxY family transcription antiterminator [Chitinophaga flava]RBL91046.1 antitermination protein NusG [Chitinophaga flava]
MNSFPSGWYVIYTRPRYERKVATVLDFKSILSFLPMNYSLRIWGGKKRYVEMPMFPSYLFVFLDDISKYYEVMKAEGFLYYVKFGKQIARVSEVIVNNIRLITGERTSYEITSEEYSPGRQVTITQGALKDLSAEVIRAEGKEKILIRVNLLKRNILVTLPQGVVA